MRVVSDQFTVNTRQSGGSPRASLTVSCLAVQVSICVMSRQRLPCRANVGCRALEQGAWSSCETGSLKRSAQLKGHLELASTLGSFLRCCR